MKEKMKEKVYCMKRMTEGHCWLETGSISEDKKMTQEKSDYIDKQIPDWAAENIQVGIVPLLLEEIDEEEKVNET